MGRAYSVNGYLNATLRRTCKTVLVEGPSDKQALHRLQVEKFPRFAGKVAIDHAGMLDDVPLAGLGNRDRVHHVQTSADHLATTMPKIGRVLATLTDREWDGITFSQYAPHPNWTPPQQQSNRFVTLGHSIENYFFDSDCAKEYLKSRFAEHTSATLLAAVDDRFPALLVFATVLSIKLRDDACLGRSEGMIDLLHFDFRNGRYYLDASFSSSCIGRNVSSAATIVNDVNLAIDATWSKLHGQTYAQWLPHGHIGQDIVWAGVAHISKSMGVDSKVATQIARGHKQAREIFINDWLSKSPSKSQTPLDSAIDWLCK